MILHYTTVRGEGLSFITLINLGGGGWAEGGGMQKNPGIDNHYLSGE